MPIGSRFYMTWGEFAKFLFNFEDSVADGNFNKMDYHMWRKFKYNRSQETEVIIEKTDDKSFMIIIGNEKEYHRFFRGDNSFGDFIFERFLKEEWEKFEIKNEYMTSEGDITKTKNAVDLQCTSSNAYSKKNFKIDFAQSESITNAALKAGEEIAACAKATKDRLLDCLSGTGIGVMPIATDTETSVSCVIDTKVDKEEFDIRINEITSKLEKLTKNEESKNMKGFNFDFGPVNGNAVRMSMYGLAVKNKVGTFVSYDTKSGEIMDVDVFNFDGANFLYKMPVAMKDISIGDVVIHHNAPMFVVGKSDDNKGLVVIDVIAGERKEIMLAKSPFGFNFATKVVNFLGGALNGSANADNPFGNMWMLMAMSGDNKDMNDMLPFMMMANGGNIDPNMLMFMAMSGKGNSDMLPMLMMMNMNANPAPAHECKCGGNCGDHHQ